jgi:hypothetical protein
MGEVVKVSETGEAVIDDARLYRTAISHMKGRHVDPMNEICLLGVQTPRSRLLTNMQPCKMRGQIGRACRFEVI